MTVGVADAARAVLKARRGGPPVAVVSRADENGGGRRILVFPSESRGSLGSDALDDAARELGSRLLVSSEDDAWTVQTPDGSTTLYVEVHRRPGRLFVVGAGHIGLALTRVAALVGFPTVVMDDREDFTGPDRFPEGVEVHRLDFTDPFAEAVPERQDLVVLVTRAHRYDYDCLKVLLDGPIPRYVGMVGSRRRVRAAFRQLMDDGIAVERLMDIHAPIGVAIGAETPEEIAVAIAAELVAASRGVWAGGSLRDREKIVERFLEDGTGEE